MVVFTPHVTPTVCEMRCWECCFSSMTLKIVAMFAIMVYYATQSEMFQFHVLTHRHMEFISGHETPMLKACDGRMRV